MASIREVPRQDGSTAYAALFRVDGRQSTLTFDIRKHAEAFTAAVDAHGAKRAMEMHGINPEPRRRHPKAKMTVAEWIRHHIDHLTGVEQYTIDKYEAYLRNDITPTLGGIPLDELSADDIANWVKMLETTGGRDGKGHAPKTLKNKYGFLSGALNAAVPKRIPANPAAGRRLSRGDADDDHDIRMLSRDEYDAFLAGVTDYWKPLIEFMVASGCRWGEVSALQPKHIDVAAGTVKIRQAWKYSSNGYTLGPPKTKRSRRDVSVSTRLLEGLDLSSEWVFTNTTGGPVRYYGFKRRVWNAALKRSGLDQMDPKPTPHDLRHTYASWQLIGGTPMPVVSRQLGHENISVTVDIYGDIDRASSRAAADFMDQALAPRITASG